MKITFTALGIEFHATVKYEPGTPAVPMRNGDPGDPPEAADIDILSLTHIERGMRINKVYDCIFLLGADCGETIIDAAMEAAVEERKRLRESDAIDRAEHENERFRDWSAA